MPSCWIAGPDEAETVARLLVGFRDHLGKDWPSDNAFLAGTERLFDDPMSEFVLGSVDEDSPPAGVAALRYRYGIWRAGFDCLVEDLYVEDHARRAGLGRAIMDFAVARARGERRCRRMELDVNERNEAALALYGSLGFSATDNPYGARDLYMRLHLDAGPDAHTG